MQSPAWRIRVRRTTGAAADSHGSDKPAPCACRQQPSLSLALRSLRALCNSQEEPHWRQHRARRHARPASDLRPRKERASPRGPADGRVHRRGSKSGSKTMRLLAISLAWATAMSASAAPDSYHQQADAKGTNTEAAIGNWWGTLNDPELTALIDRAV